jgi:hypothetical protein
MPPHNENPALSKEDYATMNNVRSNIWKNGLYGLGGGSLSGGIIHSLFKMGNGRLWKLPLNRNTAMLSVFLGGAAGSFIMSVTTGKNSVSDLHQIFEVGKRTPSTYQETLQRARDREIELRTLEFHQSSKLSDPSSEETVARHRSRLYRRATIEKRVSDGGGGLSDAHGGHWVEPKK